MPSMFAQNQPGFSTNFTSDSLAQSLTSQLGQKPNPQTSGANPNASIPPQNPFSSDPLSQIQGANFMPPSNSFQKEMNSGFQSIPVQPPVMLNQTTTPLLQNPPNPSLSSKEQSGFSEPLSQPQHQSTGLSQQQPPSLKDQNIFEPLSQQQPTSTNQPQLPRDQTTSNPQPPVMSQSPSSFFTSQPMTNNPAPSAKDQTIFTTSMTSPSLQVINVPTQMGSFVSQPVVGTQVRTFAAIPNVINPNMGVRPKPISFTFSS